LSNFDDFQSEDNDPTVILPGSSSNAFFVDDLQFGSLGSKTQKDTTWDYHNNEKKKTFSPNQPYFYTVPYMVPPNNQYQNSLKYQTYDGNQNHLVFQQGVVNQSPNKRDSFESEFQNPIYESNTFNTTYGGYTTQKKVEKEWNKKKY